MNSAERLNTVAFVSILNGVFLNIMPEITVSFALAAIAHIPEEKRYEQLPADLINFGFLKSGHSCLEKLQMFNYERGDIIRNPENAVALYNAIKSELTAGTQFVDGIVDLLTDLRSMGVRTFTTSVVSQIELDQQMKSTPQGKEIMPVLNEALGAQENFKKLAGHLRYIAAKYPQVNKCYLLFDAPSEIHLGRDARNEFDVRVVGLAVPLTNQHVLQAFKKGQEILKRINQGALSPKSFSLTLSPGQLALPSGEELKQHLSDAGADNVVEFRNRDSLKEISQDLRIHCT